MSHSEFTPDELELIERLRNAPQRRLSPRTLRAIHEKVLAQAQNPPVIVASPRAGGVPPRLLKLAVGLAASVVVVLVGAILLSDGLPSSQTADPLPQTLVALQDTATPSPTDTQPPTFTLSPTITPAPTDAPLPTADLSVAPAGTPAPTAEGVRRDEIQIVIEGTVESIEENLIVIHGFSIEVPPAHPILNVLDVGDELRIEGAFTAGNRLFASVIDNLLDDAGGDATVGLAGPIEAIEDNIITINGIDLAVDPDDPLLRTLQVGDFLDVQGNFELQPTGYLLVVVSVEIIAEAGGVISPNCVFEETGMGMGMGMGRWRCNGMGAMGMGGMGGMGMGMGMGN